MAAYYLMLRAYGDCVISHGLLARLPAGAQITVLGTRLAAEVARTLGFGRFPVEPLLEDVAAFFDLRRRGAFRALADVFRVRSALSRRLRPGDRLFFEHTDWRNAALVSRHGAVDLREPPRSVSIYEDRRIMLGTTFGDLAPWNACPSPGRAPRSLVIHPGARQAFKRLPSSVVQTIVQEADRRNLEVCLLDGEGEHLALRDRVQAYRARTSLDEAVQAVATADAYIGADSFFMHVAFHFGKPIFAVIPAQNSYFAPPGLIAAGNVMPLEEARLPQRLAARLAAFFDGGP